MKYKNFSPLIMHHLVIIERLHGIDKLITQPTCDANRNYQNIKQYPK